MRRLAAVMREQMARKMSAHFMEDREAIRLITKNKEIPLNIRMKAQQMLVDFPRTTVPSNIKDRCIVNGNAKSIIKDYKMNRIAFREQALMGYIPGIKKAR